MIERRKEKAFALVWFGLGVLFISNAIYLFQIELFVLRSGILRLVASPNEYLFTKFIFGILLISLSIMTYLDFGQLTSFKTVMIGIPFLANSIGFFYFENGLFFYLLIFSILVFNIQMWIRLSLYFLLAIVLNSFYLVTFPLTFFDMIWTITFGLMLVNIFKEFVNFKEFCKAKVQFKYRLIILISIIPYFLVRNGFIGWFSDLID